MQDLYSYIDEAFVNDPEVDYNGKDSGAIFVVNYNDEMDKDEKDYLDKIKNYLDKLFNSFEKPSKLGKFLRSVKRVLVRTYEIFIKPVLKELELFDSESSVKMYKLPDQYKYASYNKVKKKFYDDICNQIEMDRPFMESKSDDYMEFFTIDKNENDLSIKVNFGKRFSNNDEPGILYKLNLK